MAIEGTGATSRQADWGGLSVALGSFRAGTDLAALLYGLPDGRCPCPHWGYVVEGRSRVRYPGREEVVSAGDAYYLPPGHVSIFEEDTDVVEFSPREAYQAVYDVIARNAAALELERRAEASPSEP
ncbi:MAG: cupin domain-containing protein [Chloroflexota bacterium]|nr:cupin domain-containing protein [Chloroflexota bacterium]